MFSDSSDEVTYNGTIGHMADTATSVSKWLEGSCPSAVGLCGHVAGNTSACQQSLHRPFPRWAGGRTPGLPASQARRSNPETEDT